MLGGGRESLFLGFSRARAQRERERERKRERERERERADGCQKLLWQHSAGEDLVTRILVLPLLGSLPAGNSGTLKVLARFVWGKTSDARNLSVCLSVCLSFLSVSTFSALPVFSP